MSVYGVFYAAKQSLHEAAKSGDSSNDLELCDIDDYGNVEYDDDACLRDGAKAALEVFGQCMMSDAEKDGNFYIIRNTCPPYKALAVFTAYGTGSGTFVPVSIIVRQCRWVTDDDGVEKFWVGDQVGVLWKA